jgi:hypothetical protein
LRIAVLRRFVKNQVASPSVRQRIHARGGRRDRGGPLKKTVALLSYLWIIVLHHHGTSSAYIVWFALAVASIESSFTA